MKQTVYIIIFCLFLATLLAVASCVNKVHKAQETGENNDILDLADAIEEYYVLTGKYPESNQIDGIAEGTWVYQLYQQGILSPTSIQYEISLDHVLKVGEIKTFYGKDIHFRLFGMGAKKCTAQRYQSASDMQGTYFVWHTGDDGIEDFLRKEPNWHLIFPTVMPTDVGIDITREHLDKLRIDDFVSTGGYRTMPSRPARYLSAPITSGTPTLKEALKEVKELEKQ